MLFVVMISMEEGGRLMEFSFSSTILLLQKVGMDLFFLGELASFLGGFVESLLEMR